jgi:hypothetical protein
MDGNSLARTKFFDMAQLQLSSKWHSFLITYITAYPGVLAPLRLRLVTMVPIGVTYLGGADVQSFGSSYIIPLHRFLSLSVCSKPRLV